MERPKSLSLRFISAVSIRFPGFRSLIYIHTYIHTYIHIYIYIREREREREGQRAAEGEKVGGEGRVGGWGGWGEEGCGVGGAR